METCAARRNRRLSRTPCRKAHVADGYPAQCQNSLSELSSYLVFFLMARHFSHALPTRNDCGAKQLKKRPSASPQKANAAASADVAPDAFCPLPPEALGRKASNAFALQTEPSSDREIFRPKKNAPLSAGPPHDRPPSSCGSRRTPGRFPPKTAGKRPKSGNIPAPT